MAQADTGLGWSIDENYLVTSNILLGYITSLNPLTEYMAAGLLPTGHGSPAEVYARGKVIYHDLNFTNRYRYILADIGVSMVAVHIGGDPASSTNPLDVYLISDTPSAKAYGITYDINTQAIVGSMSTYTLTSRTGSFYYYRISSSQAAGYDASMNPHYDTLALAVADLGAVSQPVYKLNEGPAGAAWVRWQDLNGSYVTAPTLISTVPDNTTLSFDGVSPATGASAGMLYEGLQFTITLLPGHLGGFSPGAVPFLDFTTAFPRPIGLAPLFEAILIAENVQITSSPDPYNEPASESGGGDGENDEEDNVDFTDPPSTSIGATGLLTIFCPSLAQLQSLGNYMWSTFDVDNWRKIIANPMDAILGLHTIPIPAVITGTKAVKVAGIDTTIDMSYTTVRYIRRSLGTCEIPKKWGAYLDYSPYTKISIFLPFIGFKELDTDDIMGQTISLQYIIDILTGACVAELKCGDTVLYSWSGNCANEVPISGSDWRGAIASAISIAATVAGTALVTGGATAPMAASMVASVGANSMNLKPTINRSGAISGSAGYMSQKRPYIIRSIPNLVIPANQNKFIGYPSFVTTSLGSLSGYNEIASVHLEGIPATGNELSEIETLLKGGVIF